VRSLNNGSVTPNLKKHTGPDVDENMKLNDKKYPNHRCDDSVFLACSFSRGATYVITFFSWWGENEPPQGQRHDACVPAWGGR